MNKQQNHLKVVLKSHFKTNNVLQTETNVQPLVKWIQITKRASTRLNEFMFMDCPYGV